MYKLVDLTTLSNRSCIRGITVLSDQFHPIAFASYLRLLAVTHIHYTTNCQDLNIDLGKEVKCR